MNIEMCMECGFDASNWSDREACAALVDLPERIASAVAKLSSDELRQRHIDGQWSIAEYVDHVREVLFGMRFLLEMTLSEPGSDLGASPSTPFEAIARDIDIHSALEGIDQEVELLAQALSELSPDSWESTVKLDGEYVDAHWIVRHAVHDSTHHLQDIERLRLAR